MTEIQSVPAATIRELKDIESNTRRATGTQTQREVE